MVNCFHAGSFLWPEEFVRRGEALVERKVRPNLTPADEDKFVAIDIETGEYELDKNEPGRSLAAMGF